MLNLKQIKEYYPDNEKVFERNIIREYIQHKILESIFDSPYARKLSFLGGTVLRIVYHNDRFSEDLDFDNVSLTQEDFEALTQKVKKDLELHGYSVEMRNVYKEAYRSYIRIPHTLFENKLSPLNEEKIMIQMDTFPQRYPYTPDKVLLNKFDVFTEIYTTPLDILLSQKIYAAINRKQAKGRDFFDIVFLMPKTEPHYDYLKKTLGVENKQELQNLLLKETTSIDFSQLANDIKPFIINPQGVKKVTLFRDYVASWK